jgi:nucleoside-diphosphate-sugar epimerase
LGRRVVADLLRDGATVRCLVRPSSDVTGLKALLPAGDLERLEFIRGDLTRPDACAAAVAGCETVFHVAAEMSGATAMLFLSNVVGTRRLIDAALRERVSRFVLVSSIAVYDAGSLPIGSVVNEKCALDPLPYLRDPYTYSKVCQERVAWEAVDTHGLPLVIIRPGNIYGPGRDCLGGRVGIRLGNWMVVMGGRQRMPYTHVANCAAAIVRAGTQADVEGKAFNIVDDDLPTGRDLTRQYRSEVGGLRRLVLPRWAVAAASRLCAWYHQKSRGQLPAILTPYKSRAMWKPLQYSNERARQSLGWIPKVDLTTGMRETMAWLQAARPSAA